MAGDQSANDSKDGKGAGKKREVLDLLDDAPKKRARKKAEPAPAKEVSEPEEERKEVLDLIEEAPAPKPRVKKGSPGEVLPPISLLKEEEAGLDPVAAAKAASVAASSPKP